MHPALNLPGLTAVAYSETENQRIYTLEPQILPSCPQCGSQAFPSPGSTVHRYVDLPLAGKRVAILMGDSYSCQSCGTFFKFLPDCIANGRRVTQRLLKSIQHDSFFRTFEAIGRETGISGKTVSNIFREMLIAWDLQHIVEPPAIMGIRIVHQLYPRILVSNVEHHAVMEYLPNAGDSLAQYLAALPNSSRITSVIIDPSSEIFANVQKYLPHSQILVPIENLFPLLWNGLNSFRTHLLLSHASSTLFTWNLHTSFRPLTETEKRFFKFGLPEVLQTYEAAEEFLSIFSTPNGDAAHALWKKWLAKLPASLSPYFDPLVAEVTTWGPWLFAMCDYSSRFLSYFTTFNALAHQIDRVGQDYGFDMLRAKLLFNQQLQIEVEADSKSLVENPSPFPDPPQSNMAPYHTYGTDIGRLTDLIATEALRR